MLYEKTREMAELSVQNWLTNEVFSTGWFVAVGFLMVFYVVWLKLLDRSRATGLLLIGSLAAVAYTLNSMLLGTMLGIVEYTARTCLCLFPSSYRASPCPQS